MTIYDASIDSSNRNSSHALVLELVGRDKTVLDVGCATGYLAEALSGQGCTVHGVERDAGAAELARPLLASLVVGDLEEMSLAESFPGARFDRVVLADVLEHLTDPLRTLRQAVEILADSGEVVVSIPNVAHGSLRLALLQGTWRYTPTGLLDETHVRFLTLDGVVGLLADAGLEVDQAWATTADPLATEVAVEADALPEGIVEWVRHQPRALDYQYVVAARRTDAPRRDRPDVQVAVPDDEVRREDDHTARARRIAGEQHAASMRKDYVIGLEAQVARAEADARAAREEAVQLRQELQELNADRAEIYRSRTWRLGRLATAPVRAAKRAAR
jgi:2-polyprenyl-3-methyl-5-hydroxy-6-metoxy-1,4-benzoquinol methylase